MDKEKPKKPAKTVSRTVCILWVIIALLIGGGVGYLIGKQKGTEDAEAKVKQGASALEQDLDQAKSAVGNEASESQQSIEELQNENAQLEAKIQQQDQKIADLEKQLEEAQKPDDDTPAAQ